nr:MAG TPA: hypothetical protein [Bacteriophage sp.]
MLHFLHLNLPMSFTLVNSNTSKSGFYSCIFAIVLKTFLLAMLFLLCFKTERVNISDSL